MKKVSIGVTMHYGEAALLRNGNNQNADLLYDLIKNTKKYRVFKVCLDSQFKENPSAKHKNYLSISQAIKKIDILLCPVFTLDFSLYEKAIDNNVKIVDIFYGNIYASMAADLLKTDNLDNFSDLMLRSNPSKEGLWISPHYEEQLQLNSCSIGIDQEKTTIVPYLWKPKYLKMFFNNNVEHVKYENHKNKNSVGIYEPNINHTKTLICPAYTILDYHKRVGFSEEQRLNFYGIPKYNQNKIVNFFNSFPKDLIPRFAINYRKPINQILEESGTILSHQLGNSLNYTTLEALYLGLPIVHNSDHIMAGYRYEGYNVIDASKLLEQAFNHQDSDLVAYREAADEEIWKYSPDNEKNISTYIKLIEELMDT